MKILYIFLELTTKLDFSFLFFFFFFFWRGGGGGGVEKGMISLVNCPFRVFFTVTI